MGALPKISAVGLTMATLAGFGVWSVATAEQAQLPGPKTPDLVMLAASASYPDDFRVKIARAIARSPLDQNRLNALYVFEAGGTARPEMSIARLRGALAETGWRSTAAQQNMIVWAVEQGNLRMLVDRADGLLRRQRLEPEARELLYLFESSNETRSYIVRALSRRPIWRNTYLVDPKGMATPARLDARALTMEAMLRHGIAVDRAELAPLLSLLVKGGKAERAHALWSRFARTNSNSGPLNDPNFKEAAALSALDGQPNFPFEWQFESGRGYGASVVRAAGSSEIHIRWDGRGLPVFLRQWLNVSPGRYTVRLAGLDAKPEVINGLSIAAECPGAVTRFERIVTSDTRGGLVLAGDRAIECRFPEFRISGQVDERQRAFEISLSSITLSRL